MNEEPTGGTQPHKIPPDATPMSPRQYADLMGVSLRSVRSWMRAGQTLPRVAHLERTNPPEAKLPRWRLWVTP